MIYDEEQYIRDLETIFKSKLNAAIAEINSEKAATGTDLELATIPNDQYIFQAIDPMIVLNMKGFFVFFGLFTSPLDGVQEDNSIMKVSASFEVGTFDGGEKDRSVLIYKLLRYRRALIRVSDNNFDGIRSFGKLKVNRLDPNAMPLDNSGKNIILKVGIDINASITTN